MKKQKTQNENKKDILTKTFLNLSKNIATNYLVKLIDTLINFIINFLL